MRLKHMNLLVQYVIRIVTGLGEFLYWPSWEGMSDVVDRDCVYVSWRVVATASPRRSGTDVGPSRGGDDCDAHLRVPTLPNLFVISTFTSPCPRRYHKNREWRWSSSGL